MTRLGALRARTFRAPAAHLPPRDTASSILIARPLARARASRRTQSSRLSVMTTCARQTIDFRLPPREEPHRDTFLGVRGNVRKSGVSKWQGRSGCCAITGFGCCVTSLSLSLREKRKLPTKLLVDQRVSKRDASRQETTTDSSPFRNPTGGTLRESGSFIYR